MCINLAAIVMQYRIGAAEQSFCLDTHTYTEMLFFLPDIIFEM